MNGNEEAASGIARRETERPRSAKRIFDDWDTPTTTSDEEREIVSEFIREVRERA